MDAVYRVARSAAHEADERDIGKSTETCREFAKVGHFFHIDSPPA
jgi:hypothetical protein